MEDNRVKEYFLSLPEANRKCLLKIYHEEDKTIVFGTIKEPEIKNEIKKIIEGEIK